MRLLPALLALASLWGGDPSWAQGAPSRVPGSPYPATKRPDTLWVVNDAGFTGGQRLAVETLQGLLARSKPRLYRDITTHARRWVDDLVATHGITADRTLQNDFAGLLRRFKADIQGYILCDLNTHSAQVAISLCASRGAIAATPDLVATLAGLGIPQVLDARPYDEEWAFSQGGATFSRSVVGYLIENKGLNLADFSVLAGAFHFYDPIDGPLAAKVLARMQTNGVLLGWGESELDLVRQATAHSLHVHPADFANNLSTLSQLQVETRQAPPPAAFKTVENTHVVCFLMSDGDNLQWLLGDFLRPSWYGSAARGQANLGWTLSPALSELAPTVMDWLYRKASAGSGARDHFVAAPSGMGYMFPDRFPALDSAAALTARFMKKADLRILNILGDGAQTASAVAYLKQDGIDAVFYYPFSDYSGLRGSITFQLGKPVIGGFANLWSGFETTASLAARLNARARNPRSAGGYSLIPVHVWSHTVDSVVRCASLLDPAVRVVTPDEFVHLIRANLGPASPVRPEARLPASVAAKRRRGFRANGALLPCLPSGGTPCISATSAGRDSR